MRKNDWINLMLAFVFSQSVVAMADVDSDVMKADANHDGKVSFEEYKAAHEAELRERFKNRDMNQDGFIDLEEKQVAQEKKKEQQQLEQEEELKRQKEKYAKDREIRRKHFYKFE